jgi:steroid delta-isomerase-like uncharacterized protein
MLAAEREDVVTEDLVAQAWAQNDAFNCGDWEAFRAAVAPDSVYEEVATGRVTRSPDDHIALAQGWKSAFPDATGTLDQAYVSGNTVIQEITWSGTQTGELPMPNGTLLPPTGKKISMKAVLITQVENGKAKHNRHYLDLLAMLTQLGVIPS